MLAVAESLVTLHNVTVPTGLGSTGVLGRTYSDWYPLLSLISVPLVAVAHFFSQHLQLPFHYVAAMFALVVQVPLTAATAGLVALLSMQLGATRRGAWLAAISFGFGTVALVYVRTFFAEPLLAFLVAFALFLAFRLTPSSTLGSAVLALLAVLAKPTGIFIGPILSAYLFIKGVPWRRAILPFSGSVCGFALYAIYNLLRFGNPLEFGQKWAFHLSYLPSGAAGLLASPGWGLIWYCPPVLLCMAAFRYAYRSRRFETLAIIATFLVFLAFHSFYLNWYAGWSWGPRYLVPALPGLCSLLGLLSKRATKAARGPVARRISD